MDEQFQQPVQAGIQAMPIKKKSRWWIWMIIVIVIIGLGIGGVLGYNYLSKPRIIEEQIEGTNMITCIDPDGYDIYTRAESSYSGPDEDPGEISRGSLEDICDYFHEKTDSNVGLVREGVCEGSTFKMVWSTCGRGYVCRNAACVKGDESSPICHDSDGGKNSNQKGNVIARGGSAEDTCGISTDGTEAGGGSTDSCSGEECYVNEYFCENDVRTQELIKCSNGCDDGRCL